MKSADEKLQFLEFLENDFKVMKEVMKELEFFCKIENFKNIKEEDIHKIEKYWDVCIDSAKVFRDIAANYYIKKHSLPF